MSRVWFTSDLHFNHQRLAEIRGFRFSEEHDAVLIENWNRHVKSGDQVWVLGDVGMGHPAAFLPKVDKLNGTKHLISGNHDAVWPGHKRAHIEQRSWLGPFESVQPFAKKKMLGHEVLMSHFPYSGDHTETDRYSQYRLVDDGRFLLHGHTHSDLSVDANNLRQIHIGLDAWHLEPVSLRTIEILIRHVEEWEQEGARL